MTEILKGNFKPKKKVTLDADQVAEAVEERFEREALKNLGGSICYVAKKKVNWDIKEDFE